jgi:nucleoside-diphosphate-sugar epimerase
MKIVISGGSGQVGTILARAFHRDRHDVTVLSRHPQVQPWRVVAWDGATLTGWAKDLDLGDSVLRSPAPGSARSTRRQQIERGSSPSGQR